jgi:dephospho-CoA kinase
MKMVGLTGGIGAGKSAVAQRFAELGAIVVDSDELAREVVEPGTDGFRRVVEAFGESVVGPDGALDRPALGRRVFGDDAARKTLEGIVHPLVRERSAALIAAAPPESVVVHDIPLLVEAGMAAAFDEVVVVLASEEIRLDRLTRLRGMPVEDARARMAKQATDEQRRAAATVVIVNEGTPADLRAQVDAAWASITG